MKSLLKLLPYIGRYKGRVILGIIAVTLSNIFAVAIPWVIGRTIDDLQDGITAGQIVERVLIIIGLAIVSGIFLFWTRQTIIVMSRLVEYDLRNDFLKHVQSLSMKYFTSTTTGDVMALATNDIPRVREFVGPALMYTVNTVTKLVFTLALMLTLSVKITLLALIPLPLVSYTVYILGRKIHKLFGDVQSQYADLTSSAQESISGVRVIRGYVREAYSESLFRKLSDLYRAKNMELVKVDALMMPAMMTLIGLSQVIVLAVGGYEVMQGDSTIGDVTQFTAYISELIWPVIAIGWVTNLVQRAAASMDRLEAVFSIVPDVADSFATDEKVGEIKGRIEFRDVTFRYDPEMPVALKNVTFRVEPGETLAIVGPTGAGKSTIAGLIARLQDVTDGEILIDDRPITTIPLETLRSSLGAVTQETFLFSKTVADNIRFGRPDAALDEVVDASELSQLHDNVVGFTNEYDTMVGERGVTLSGGQKQRSSIARAVLRRPAILMLDDALSAVDTETEERILGGLRGVMKDRTTILIAHRISTVKDADKIIVLRDGEVAEAGTHDELVAHGGWYASTYEKQLLEQALERM